MVVATLAIVEIGSNKSAKSAMLATVDVGSNKSAKSGRRLTVVAFRLAKVSIVDVRTTELEAVAKSSERSAKIRIFVAKTLFKDRDEVAGCDHGG